MTLVRPLMTNFKTPVRADCIVSTCSPLPLSIKALAPWLSGEGGVGLWTGVRPPHPPHLLPASKIKQTFISTNLASSLAFERRAAGPGFGNNMSGVRCHVHASSTSGCALVYCTVQCCIEYSSTVSLFQAQDAWVKLQFALCLLLLTILAELYHLPPPLPPPVSNSSCLFTRCQPLVLYASCCTVLLYFSRYCTVRLKMFSFSVFVFDVLFVWKVL